MGRLGRITDLRCNSSRVGNCGQNNVQLQPDTPKSGPRASKRDENGALQMDYRPARQGQKGPLPQKHDARTSWVLTHGKPLSGITDSPLAEEDPEGPLTKSFIETLFSSLPSDSQVVKKDLSADLKAVRSNLEQLGALVSAMEDHEARHEQEVDWLHQEVLRLKEQHVELQAHA
ncbi:hypothetical protein NDU88_001176 [Pleurodeles waltl]|uniref:Uncharacterized protein n=1 Tax=Pleurodeles waltl TaxID=8319 RepID=A0AAV7LX26_PLEWA|nr:hypothetical protein NDU88_001176 [Pleurodeles waltl]